MAQIADIVSVVAPANVVAGEYAIVDVHVKNLATSGVSRIAVTAGYDSSTLSWQFDYLDLLPGETVVFRGWFVMPPKNVSVTFWAWYWAVTGWRPPDDQVTKNIAVAAEPVAAFSELKALSFTKA